jgi:hypothetical protein
MGLIQMIVEVTFRNLRLARRRLRLLHISLQRVPLHYLINHLLENAWQRAFQITLIIYCLAERHRSNNPLHIHHKLFNPK